jgi:hypothetical protein
MTVGKSAALMQASRSQQHREATASEKLTRVSVMIEPEADHVNTSICPGVSNNTYLHSLDLFSIKLKI